MANLRATPDPFYVTPGGSATSTLQVDLVSSGNTLAVIGNSIEVRFWDGDPHAPGSNLITSQTVDDIPGRGRFTTVVVEWPNRTVGEHTWNAELVPIAGETDLSDNVASSVVIDAVRTVPTARTATSPPASSGCPTWTAPSVPAAPSPALTCPSACTP